MFLWVRVRVGEGQDTQWLCRYVQPDCSMIPYFKL